MKEENKIYLTEPKHYLYREWLKEVPEDLDFIERDLSLDSLLSIDLKQCVSYVRDKLKNRINSHIVVSDDDYDLIHSNGSLIYNPDRPWVVDFEDGTAFTFLQTPSEREKRKVTREISSESCRKLMPHCEAAKKSFYSIYEPDEKIREKTEVIYPGLKAPENYDKESGKFSILFVAREFERKGGYEAYRAFKQVKEEFESVEFICVSDTPEDVKNEDFEDTRFHQDISRERLYDLYREADLFVYPTYHDTFGLVMLEAMAFGNPVITLDAFATGEIVSDGEDGYIVEGYNEKWFDLETKIRIDKYNDWEELREHHSEEEKDRIVQDLSRKISGLLEDEELYEKLESNARRKIESGKFSVEERNSKLERIYSEAIED